MTEALISVKHLERSFRDVNAVRDISFDILPGQVMGFIGANGAGKTTTMRIMATLDVQDFGSVTVCGHDTLEDQANVRRLIGWMPDAYGPYEFMTVFEYLDFFARSYGYTGRTRRERIEEIMDFTELQPIAERYVDKLSKGMGQRLCLGRTLLHDPHVLILDEPAAGLDPKARVEFKHLIRILAEEGKTIFLSSHILSELEDMCDTLLFIDEGKVVYQGTAAELKRQAHSQTIINIKVCGEIPPLREALLLYPGVEILASQKSGLQIALENDEPQAAADLLRHLVRNNLPVLDFHLHEHRLEDSFMDMLERLQKSTDNEKPKTDSGAGKETNNE